MTRKRPSARKPTGSATRPPSGSCSRRNSPARSPASPFRKSSRGCSRSTTRSAPARNAAALASSSISIPSLVIPDKERTLRKGAISPWAKSSSPYYVQTLARARQALQVHARHQVEGSAEEDPGCDPLRLRRHRNPLLLRRRHARLRHQAAVRRRHHQSRAPLPRNRFRLGARGDLPIFHRRALRGLSRLPAKTRSLVRAHRRKAYRRGLRSVGRAAAALVRRAAGQAQRQAERDRRPHPQGNPRAA